MDNRYPYLSFSEEAAREQAEAIKRRAKDMEEKYRQYGLMHFNDQVKINPFDQLRQQAQKRVAMANGTEEWRREMAQKDALKQYKHDAPVDGLAVARKALDFQPRFEGDLFSIRWHGEFYKTPIKKIPKGENPEEWLKIQVQRAFMILMRNILMKDSPASPDIGNDLLTTVKLFELK